MDDMKPKMTIKKSHPGYGKHAKQMEIYSMKINTNVVEVTRNRNQRKETF